MSTALDALDSILPRLPAEMAHSRNIRPPTNPKLQRRKSHAMPTWLSRATPPPMGMRRRRNTTGPPSNPTGTQDDNPKRILGFIPNFQTKNDDPANQQPLTVKQKYILSFHQTVDFSAHIGNLFQAALQQASDTQPHYGEGWGPYAERFGAAEGDQATSSFFIFGLLPSILHDDPRYFRKGPSHSF